MPTPPAPGLPPRLLLAVAVPFGCGYFVSYLFRSINAVIAPDLAAEFGLGAAELGLLTSAYFISFAAFQLPLGILLDRYGPRRVNAALLLVAGAGAALFAAGASAPALLGARALIGLGVSACLMSSIKAFVLWFPLRQLPALTGAIMFAGGLGAIAATAPVEAALGVTDWRGVFLALAALTFAVAGAVFFVVPERAAGGAAGSWRGQAAGLIDIFASRRFWQITLVAMLTQSTFMALQGLWAGPWLRDIAGLERMGVASHLLAIAAAAMAGQLVFGNGASWLAARGVATGTVFKAGLLAATLAQAVVVVVGGVWSWFAYAFCVAAGTLSYSVLSQHFAPGLAGRVNTALNFMVFVCAFASQWSVGAIINLWPVVAGGYHPAGYQAAFGLFAVLQAAALAWLVLDESRSRRASVA